MCVCACVGGWVSVRVSKRKIRREIEKREVRERETREEKEEV